MTVSEKLRLVQGLHSHAEMFGFNWNDDSDWTWHDVACKIADEIDAENARLRERLVHMELHECPRCRNVADLQAALAENTKLRKLIADIHALDDLCYIPSWSLDEYGVRMADIERRMRELGVEVDG